MSESVVYQGERYWVQSSGRYFTRRRKNGERLLHRRVWTDHHGPIPDGFVVHHKDNNWRNNDISNLEMVENIEHCRYHMQERLEDPVFRKNLEEYRMRAIEKAPEWHRSAKGRAWHAEHGRSTWEKREAQTLENPCAFCGGSIVTKWPTRTRFCSDGCQKKYAGTHERHRIWCVETQCLTCGIAFKGNKYRQQSFCSRKCSAARRNESWRPFAQRDIQQAYDL